MAELERAAAEPWAEALETHTATYDSGILEVKVPVAEPKTQSHRIPIKQPK